MNPSNGLLKKCGRHDLNDLYENIPHKAQQFSCWELHNPPAKSEIWWLGCDTKTLFSDPKPPNVYMIGSISINDIPIV